MPGFTWNWANQGRKGRRSYWDVGSDINQPAFDDLAVLKNIINIKRLKKVVLDFKTIFDYLVSMKYDNAKYASIFRKHQVSFAYLFGSVAKDQATKMSDVDIAVYFSDEVRTDQHLEKRLDLMKEFNSIFNRKIDVLVLNQRCDELALEVLKYGRILFEEDAQARIQFRYLFTRQYLDFLPYRDYYFSKILERLKTGKTCDARDQRHQESIEKIRRMHLHSEKHS